MQLILIVLTSHPEYILRGAQSLVYDLQQDIEFIPRFILLTNSRSYTVFRLVFPPPVSPRSKGPQFQDKVRNFM